MSSCFRPFPTLAALSLFLPPALSTAAEYHVSGAGGNDANSGQAGAPFKTIGTAAAIARPGDTVTVHAGVYRERVNPPRGGTGENARITYQAAPGEKVTIKGAEPLAGWEHVGGDTWKRVIPNSFFGDFNPFNNLIIGDWFASNGRSHHTGAVYLDGHWLAEASSKPVVLQAVSGTPQWFAEVDGGGYIFNVAWFQPRAGSAAGTRVDASLFSGDFGIKTTASGEGGDCAGWIEHGDWTRYDTVDFGVETDSVDFRVSSPTGGGGEIEVRLDNPAGTLLGKAAVPSTGGWTTWTTVSAAITPTGGVRRICLCFRSPACAAGNTTVWGQFPRKNPNQENVEINARQCVFYPDQPGLGYITVRGFTLEQAATPWSPPTAEQIGVVGTHWGKGWIIENNTVRYSVCAGISLGKYGDRYDNTAESAEGYNGTITRALANGWHKETVGGHIVRGNEVSHCEQVGIVGSLGCSFSTVTGNHIHDIHTRALFNGAEQAGIKFHGAIDVVIADNHIHHCGNEGGIWLDWMAQGSRVARNLMHDNLRDLLFEMNHGPMLVDHNLLLSAESLLDESHGEAFVHNLIAGRISLINDASRETPYHPPHSTAVAGLAVQTNGDIRFYNNILTGGASLAVYNNSAAPVEMGGNVFLKGAVASSREANPLALPAFDPAIRLAGGPGGYYLEMNLDPAWRNAAPRQIVTTATLGKAAVPQLSFGQADGSAYRFDTDRMAAPRASGPFPGPFETVRAGANLWKVSSDPVDASAASSDPGTLHVDVNNIHVNAGSFPGSPAVVLGEAGETWNNITGAHAATGSLPNLKNSAGTVTTVGMAWSGTTGTYTAGPEGHAYSSLLRDYAFVMDTTVCTWTISGLSPGAVFDLVVYGGANGGVFTAGGITKIASGASYGANNYNQLPENDMYVRFNGLVADPSGRVILTLAKNPAGAGGNYGSLSGISLRQTAAAPPAGITRVSGCGFRSGAFDVSASGLTPGFRYVLTRSRTLDDSFPDLIGVPVAATAADTVFSDPDPPAQRAFYRVELLP